MKVEYYAISAATKGEDFGLVGTITWNGDEYTLDPPDSVGLQNILGMTINKDGNPDAEYIDATDPEAFLHNLHLNWRSSYSYVTPPIQEQTA